jgi:glycosyltransferase involved in cell wall biosynthesis
VSELRILISAETFQPADGITMSTLQLSRSLAAAGHDLVLLHREGGPLEQEYRRFTAALHRVPSFHLRRQSALRDLVRLPPAVRAAWAADPDVIYGQRAEQIVWALAASLGGLLRRHRRTPLVLHLRHHPAGLGLRQLSRGVTGFVAVSQYVRREWIAAGVRPEAIDVVPNGVDPAEYPYGGAVERAAARRRLGLPPEAFVALYYGRVEPVKGIETLLGAWAEVRAVHPDAVLVIQGACIVHPDPAGYLARLRATAPPGVCWLPEGRDVVTPLHAADVAVLPAHWAEPFGRVVIETMATGRPVLASRVGGIPEILTGEFERLLVPPADAGALAGALLGLAGWQDREPALGKACREHVETSFTLAATTARVEAVLRGAAAERENAADARAKG